ncbi:hypothetical protein CASFOL_030477 [Castilleja foliolosa]|uniref:Uncharacterized protein n=1 Tax=Castilleja foliolosa TaxID=1961234 RepID=A0ABD3C7X7_9LAMI
MVFSILFLVNNENIQINPFSVVIPHNLSLGESRNPPYGYHPCCCSAANGGKTPPFRAWVVPKESNFGGISRSHGAWFGTDAGNSDYAEINVKEKMQRRPRSGGGGGAAVVGSPDLLAIHGVGPSNLRKLVEKGFEGVAQLKQLYKDKV